MTFLRKNGVLFILALTVAASAPCAAAAKKALAKNRAFGDKDGSETAGYTLRMPAKDAIARFKKDPAFVYERGRVPHTFRDDISAWIEKKLNELLKKFSILNQFSLRYLQIALIALFAAFFVFIFAKIFRVNLFYATGKSTGRTMEDFVGELSDPDLDSLIGEFIRMKEFRHAVRLLYHKSLFEMSKKNLIALKINKTNSDYLKEIQSEILRKEFRNITRHFEYIWYGNFETDEKSFEKLSGAFADFGRLMPAE